MLKSDLIGPEHGDLHLDVVFNCFKAVDVLLTRQRDGLSALSGTGSPAYAVDICLEVLGNVVVDDELQIIDLKAAGGYVGRNQDVQFAVLHLG